MPASSSARVRRALRLVDQLEMEPAEVKELAAQLAERPACVIDWDQVRPEDREMLAEVERRLNDPSPEFVTLARSNRRRRERLAAVRRRRATAQRA